MPKRKSDVCKECKCRFRQTGSSLCWWCARDISPQQEGGKGKKKDVVKGRAI
jgi:hypothetical protein